MVRRHIFPDIALDRIVLDVVVCLAGMVRIEQIGAKKTSFDHRGFDAELLHLARDRQREAFECEL